jgi:hypothetical protein
MIDNISWLAVYPEIVLLVMACVIALVDLFVTSPAARHLCADHADAGCGGCPAPACTPAVATPFMVSATWWSVTHGQLAQVLCHVQ